jgi:hypothetical protein
VSGKSRKPETQTPSTSDFFKPGAFQHAAPTPGAIHQCALLVE